MELEKRQEILSLYLKKPSLTVISMARKLGVTQYLVRATIKRYNETNSVKRKKKVLKPSDGLISSYSRSNITKQQAKQIAFLGIVGKMSLTKIIEGTYQRKWKNSEIKMKPILYPKTTELGLMHSSTGPVNAILRRAKKLPLEEILSYKDASSEKEPTAEQAMDMELEEPPERILEETTDTFPLEEVLLPKEEEEEPEPTKRSAKKRAKHCCYICNRKILDNRKPLDFTVNTSRVRVYEILESWTGFLISDEAKKNSSICMSCFESIKKHEDYQRQCYDIQTRITRLCLENQPAQAPVEEEVVVKQEPDFECAD